MSSLIYATSGVSGRGVPRQRLRLFGILLVVSLLSNLLLMGRPFFSSFSAASSENIQGHHHDTRVTTERAQESSRDTRHGARARRKHKRRPDRPLRSPSPQNDQGLHTLEFIHIPKTGGTSIEIAASRVGIAWGICKFAKFRTGDPQCDDIRPFRHQVKMQTSSEWQCRTQASPWHCPPLKYEAGNKFENAETFVVVRNPYERMISEYYYFFKVGVHSPKYPNFITGRRMVTGDLNDPQFMNQWIDTAVQAATLKGHCYNGHCVPFYDFVYAKDGRRVVSHVLKMESLAEDFAALMDRYQLPIKLEQHNVRTNNSTLGVADLTAETVAKINEWSKQDFALFGYDMLDPMKQKSRE